MKTQQLRISAYATVGVCVASLLSVFAPWVRAGAAAETDTINGFDIPVIGWATIILGLVVVTFTVLATMKNWVWMWWGALFVLGLMITGCTVLLSTLDVLDSAVFGWITKALPAQVEAASPQLQATAALWISYLLVLVAGLFCLTQVVEGIRSDGSVEDEWDTESDTGDEMASAPWASGSGSSFDIDRPPWA